MSCESFQSLRQSSVSLIDIDGDVLKVFQSIPYSVYDFKEVVREPTKIYFANNLYENRYSNKK